MPNKYAKLIDAVKAIPTARRVMCHGNRRSPLMREIILVENTLGLDGFRLALYVPGDVMPATPRRPDMPHLHFLGWF